MFGIWTAVRLNVCCQYYLFLSETLLSTLVGMTTWRKLEFKKPQSCPRILFQPNLHFTFKNTTSLLHHPVKLARSQVGNYNAMLLNVFTCSRRYSPSNEIFDSLKYTFEKKNVVVRKYFMLSFITHNSHHPSFQPLSFFTLSCSGFSSSLSLRRSWLAVLSSWLICSVVWVRVSSSCWSFSSFCFCSFSFMRCSSSSRKSLRRPNSAVTSSSRSPARS